jgi:hypothetical protein
VCSANLVVEYLSKKVSAEPDFKRYPILRLILLPEFFTQLIQHSKVLSREPNFNPDLKQAIGVNAMAASRIKSI